MPQEPDYPQIPGYRIEALIAEGGMARVYRAIQESLQRPVALKVLTPGQDDSFSQRFLQEGRTIAALRHPGIITIHDIGIAGEVHYISMELVEGGDLDARIGKGMPPEQALAIVRTLAETLAYVHGEGVVHRDIKPGNILFRADGTPLLSDFGIAKQLHQDLKLTQPDLALGSPFYLSPEQALGKKVDGRSDIYSLGILCYEMLSGRLPFRGKEAMDTILLHLNQPLPALKKSLQGYQPLLERMTAKAAKDRYRNCAQLLQALEALTGAEAGTDAGTKATRTVPVSQGRARKSRSAPPVEPVEPTAQLPGARLWPWWLGLALLGLVVASDGPTYLLRLAGLIEPGRPMQQPAIRWQQNEAEQVAALLAAGQAALTEDRLSLPPEQNARHYFEQALLLDPDNRDAQLGLSRIAERYGQLAGEALQRGDLNRARRHLERGLQVRPQHPDLRRLAQQHGIALPLD